jgi:arginyl-tRNA--protein-N-Asp/Glu arginylyltransferase
MLNRNFSTFSSTNCKACLYKVSLKTCNSWLTITIVDAHYKMNEPGIEQQII